MKSESIGPDRSMADFMWSKWAVECEWSAEETAEKLLEVSAKAQENARRGDTGYALLSPAMPRRLWNASADLRVNQRLGTAEILSRLKTATRLRNLERSQLRKTAHRLGGF